MAAKPEKVIFNPAGKSFKDTKPAGYTVVTPDYMFVYMEGPYLERSLLRWHGLGHDHRTLLPPGAAIAVANCLTMGKLFGMVFEPAEGEAPIEGITVTKATSLTFG